MRVFRLFTAAAISLLVAGAPMHAQQHEPGTGSTQIAPASKAPPPEQKPDVRLDSKPHTSLDASDDSSIAPPDLGLGANPTIDLGHDITPTVPAGMLSHSEPDNSRMVYFFLPQRSGDEVSSADKEVIASRQDDLARAIGRGFDPKQPGQVPQQLICPAMQPDAEVLTGLPAGGDDKGFILLQYANGKSSNRNAAFTAILPRAGNLPVRIVKVPAYREKKHPHSVNAKINRDVVNEALPPSMLYQSLAPERDWIAASACIAAMGGAHPHIPNEPYLSEAITTAPEPTLRLMLNGEHKVIFTDRLDDQQYVVWNEHISRHGRMLDAQREQVRIVPRAITNPPVPVARTIKILAQPPSHIAPEPPSPISGDKQ